MRSIPHIAAAPLFAWAFGVCKATPPRVGRHVGHSEKIVCEIGKRRHLTYTKTSDVGLLGGVGEQRVALGAPCRRTSRLLGCFRSHLMRAPVGSGEQNPSRHACHSLPSSTSNHSAGFSACLNTETCRRAELNARVEWLGTEVVYACVPSFHGSMDVFRRSRTVRSCSAGRTLAGIPAATERARVACCASARFVLSIAKQQRDPFSRDH